MRSSRHAVVAAIVAGIACSGDRGAVDKQAGPSPVATVTQALTNVTTNRGDNHRTGVYDDDFLRPNVLADFGMTDQQVELDGRTYAQPLVVQGLNLGRGPESIVFVATTSNRVHAFALKDLKLFWTTGPEVFGAPE